MINFLYDGTRVVCELDPTGNVSAIYGYGAAGLVQSDAQGQYTAYAYDPMGSVNSRVPQIDDTNAGTTTPAYDFFLYDTFGNNVRYLLPRQNVTTSFAPAVVGYGAQWGSYTDSETGLILIGWRYYAPQYARFLTRDPLGYEGGINVYAYCRNNPIMFCDPDGLTEKQPHNDLERLLYAVAKAKAQDYQQRTYSSLLEAVQAGVIASELLSSIQNPVVTTAGQGLGRVSYTGQPEVGTWIYGTSGNYHLTPFVISDSNSGVFLGVAPSNVGGSVHIHPSVGTNYLRNYFTPQDYNNLVLSTSQPAFLGLPNGKIQMLRPNDPLASGVARQYNLRPGIGSGTLWGYPMGNGKGAILKILTP